MEPLRKKNKPPKIGIITDILDMKIIEKKTSNELDILDPELNDKEAEIETNDQDAEI